MCVCVCVCLFVLFLLSFSSLCCSFSSCLCLHPSSLNSLFFSLLSSPLFRLAFIHYSSTSTISSLSFTLLPHSIFSFQSFSTSFYCIFSNNFSFQFAHILHVFFLSFLPSLLPLFLFFLLLIPPPPPSLPSLPHSTNFLHTSFVRCRISNLIILPLDSFYAHFPLAYSPFFLRSRQGLLFLSLRPCLLVAAAAAAAAGVVYERSV